MAAPIQSQHSPRQNRLLAALPAESYERIVPMLEWVALAPGEIIYEPGRPLHYAWFPTTAIVSLIYLAENGASTEVAGVGNEGMAGLAVFLCESATPSRAVVCAGGHGYKLAAQSLLEEFNRGGPMMRLMLRYTQAMLTQVSQTAVCNRHHSMEQQMCRWLLLALDRLPSQEVIVTQEMIAGMLGVRREGITETAGHLQRAGLISYHRGHITVLDRAGLEAHACECYQVVRKEFDRLL